MDTAEIQRVEFTGLQVQPTPVFTGRPVYRFTAKFTGFAAKFAGFTAKFTGFTVKFTGFTASVNTRVGFRFAHVGLQVYLQPSACTGRVTVATSYWLALAFLARKLT